MNSGLHTDGLYLLGGARVGAKVLERKTAALLALLAFERTTSRARAACLLWPEASEKTGRANLRQLLKRLRTSCGALVEGDDTLCLRSTLKVDVLIPNAALESSGELLAGYEYDECPELSDWLMIHRESWRSSLCKALAARADRMEEQGQLRSALEDARRLSHAQPESEDCHRRVMRLCHLLGDRSAALAAFESCRELTVRLCDSEVSPQTRALADTIRAGLAVRAPPRFARREIPLSVQRPPALVGRERAWAQLEEAWAERRVVYVSGEAGTGKTRLINDFAATKGDVVLSVARPGDQTVPYSANCREFGRNRDRWLSRVTPQVRHEMSRIVPGLGPPPPLPVTAAEKLQLYEAMLVAFKLIHEGSGTVFDDLHYLDPASLDACAFMTQSNGQCPSPAERIRAIVAFRPSEIAPQMLAHVRIQAEQRLVTLIELEPLCEDEVAQLVGSMGLERLSASTPEVYQRTGGNPLFVVELAKSLVEAGELGDEGLKAPPPTERVRRILERRLERLSLQALQLLQALAVLKDDFSPELAARMLELPLTDVLQRWLELDAARVVRGNWFSHDLLYEQVARTTPNEVAQVFHRQAARLLDPQKVSRERIADHWRRGGQAPRPAAVG